MGRTRRLPKLMVIADRCTTPDCQKSVMRLARSGNLDWIQLRDHSAERREFSVAARMLGSAIRSESPDTHISINTDLGLSRELEMGLHVGFRGPPPETARRELPRDLPVGYSVHAESDLTASVVESVDYLILGPIFDPISKPEVSGAGLGLLKRTSAMTTLPIFAVGGVTPDRVASCLEAGAYGIATVGGVMHSAHPSIALERYQTALRALGIQNGLEGIRGRRDPST